MVRQPSIVLVPLRCPGCGHDVGIGTHDRAFLCRRCLSLWEQKEGKLVRKAFTWIEGDITTVNYIPVWIFRMTAHTPLGTIDDYSSYCEHIAFLESIKDLENRPLSLFVVAAELSVERFRLSISRLFTYMQPVLKAGGPIGGRIWGPCIDENTAAHYARVVFISTLSEERKGSREFVEGLTLTLEAPGLVYMPFREQGSDFQDITGSITIPQKLAGKESAQFVP